MCNTMEFITDVMTKLRREPDEQIWDFIKQIILNTGKFDAEDYILKEYVYFENDCYVLRYSLVLRPEVEGK